MNNLWNKQNYRWPKQTVTSNLSSLFSTTQTAEPNRILILFHNSTITHWTQQLCFFAHLLQNHYYFCSSLWYLLDSCTAPPYMKQKKNSAVWRAWFSHLSMPLKTMTPTRLKAPSPITNACSTLLALLQSKTFFLKCATKWGYWNLTKATNWQEARSWRAMMRLTMSMSQDWCYLYRLNFYCCASTDMINDITKLQYSLHMNVVYPTCQGSSIWLSTWSSIGFQKSIHLVILH